MKRDANRYIGNYLIEHRPMDDEPYQVNDLRHLFESNHQSFNCASLKEAQALCVQLTKANKP
jgi:hypothetical protein